MKKGLSYDEEMTLLLELSDSMDEGDREGFTLEEAQLTDEYDAWKCAGGGAK